MAADDEYSRLSAAMLLKQCYRDTRMFLKKFTQFVFESVFQSVPRFSHVHCGVKSLVDLE